APGLIDGHVHFFFDGGDSPGLRYMEADDAERIRVARHNARVGLEAGITTMRDCGAPAALIFDLRRDVEAGLVPGPHILCCGQPLTRPAGHCHFLWAVKWRPPKTSATRSSGSSATGPTS
ncbi:MAG: hypothetical protein DMD79_27280, partial [Candidatus Rokuibacteriota bacterium]